MATLYITEFSEAGFNKGPLPIAMQPANTDQTVSVGVGSAQSAAFQNNTQLVRLETDVVCSIAFGTNPTATAGKARMAANTAEYFAVPLNSGLKVATITNS